MHNKVATTPKDNTGEDPKLFKLLYLWLVVSTSDTFSTPANYAEISAQTNIDPKELPTVIATVTNQDYTTLKKAFNTIATALKYTPGECPKAITTLRQVAALIPS